MITAIKTFLSIICIIYLSISPISIIKGTSYTSRDSFNQTYDTKDLKLIVELPGENISLYALDWKEESVTESGVYKKYYLM